MLGLLLVSLLVLRQVGAHLMVEQLVDQGAGQHRVALDDSRNQRFGDFDLVLLDRQAGGLEVLLRRRGDIANGVQHIAQFAMRRDALRVGSNVRTVAFDGSVDVTGGKGTVEFYNAGLQATLAAGQVGGLRLGGARVVIDDLREPTLDIDANATGDVAKALALLPNLTSGCVACHFSYRTR